MTTEPQETIEIPVSRSWIRLIQYCRTSCPFGTLTIKIVNAQPTVLVDRKVDVRFDKETSIPSFED